ncbi:unnamed protein product [Prorocentrum cordatum]|uniref:DUF4116 domain-containing protein n=1 Tax=Prorocentrum cordatum TaxID=2364126 RepID=A0ABN9PLB0_9DINO|nr:unnamed protein product [Polarella glacialis]
MACDLEGRASLACLARAPRRRDAGDAAHGAGGGMACMARGGRGPADGRDVLLRIKGGLGAETLFEMRAGLDSTVADVKAMVEPLRRHAAARAAPRHRPRPRCAAAGRRLAGRRRGRGRLPAVGPGALGGADPGAAVDVLLLRLAPAWAEAMEGLRRGSLELDEAGAAARGDRELVLAAVARCGSALERATEALRADAEVVRAAVRCDPGALRFAASELQDDRGVVLEAVRRSGHVLRHASPRLRADAEVVLAAVANSWRALEHASAELRGDRGAVADSWRRPCASRATPSSTPLRS